MAIVSLIQEKHVTMVILLILMVALQLAKLKADGHALP